MIAVALAFAACAAGPQAARAPAVVEEVRASAPTWEPPAGGDGRAHVDLQWRDPDGTLQPIPAAPAPFVDGVAFAGAAVVLDADGTLWRWRPGEPFLAIARRVVDGPVASPDGARLGFFSGARGEETSLWTWDGAVTRRLVRGLAGAAGLAFDATGERIAFVSARNGGVAGLWTTSIHPHTARCRTNCSLRAGQVRGDGWVPLPDLSTVELEGDAIRFVDTDGTAREVVP